MRSRSWPEHVGRLQRPLPRTMYGEPRHVAGTHARRRDEVDAVLELRGRRDMKRRRRRVRVRVAVRDEQEGGTAEAFDLELRLPPAAPLEQHLRDHPDERDVAGPRAVGVASELVEPAHRLAVEPEAGREAEAAAVDRAERDAARAPVGERGAERARGGDRIARQTERAREDARAPARQEAERDAPSAPFSASL